MIHRGPRSSGDVIRYPGMCNPKTKAGREEKRRGRGGAQLKTNEVLQFKTKISEALGTQAGTQAGIQRR